MRVLWNKRGQSNREMQDVLGEVVRIGSSPENDITLASPYVAGRAAILTKNGRYWELSRLGENEIQVGQQRLLVGERVIVSAQQLIEIYPYSISLEIPDDDALPEERRREELDKRMSEFILETHRQLLRRMEFADSDESRRENDEFILKLEQDVEEIARRQNLMESSMSQLLTHLAGHTLNSYLVGKIIEENVRRCNVWNLGERWTHMHSIVPDFESELECAADSMEDTFALGTTSDVSEKVDIVERGFWGAWKERSANLHSDFVRYLGLRHLKKQIKDIVFGYGPLEDLLRLPSVTEIMVVSRDRIYVEKKGVLENSGRRFVSDEVTVSIIDRIVSRVGRRIDKSQPLVDARLLDGSRVNAVISPIAISGPCLTIRKFPHKKLQIEDLIRMGSVTPTVAEFLRASVVAGKNILISGGTGTGKTTLLNCLSDFIPDKERVVTVEDTAELQLHKDHVVRMETKSANVEGAGEYTIRDLVRNTLRMRPDRIVVGECRGAEALDMLQAMNTGHDGSMTTIHANTASDVILRLEVLVQMAADLPIHSIHRQIASAIDLVVQLSRLRDGSRKVTQITEFVAYDAQEKRIRTKDIFLRDHETTDADLMPTGSLPTYMGELIENELIELESFYV